MADYLRGTAARDYQSFIHGNAAPQYEPEKIRKAKEEYLEKAAYIVEQKFEERRLSRREFSLFQVVIITSCVIVVLALSFFYLAEISALKEEKLSVETLKYQYETITSENQLVENEIASNVDYSYVYEYATQKLGMKMPEKHQIVSYSRDNTEYVAKRAEIPNE